MQPPLRPLLVLAFAATFALLTACSNGGSTTEVTSAEVEASHTPIIATDSQQVTVTAEASTDSNSYWTFIFVDGSLEEICDSQATCSVTVGPLSSTAAGSSTTGRPVNYQAMVVPVDYDSCTLSPCRAEDTNTFGVTGSNYTYNANSGNYIPALDQAPSSDAVDIVFHMAGDYTNGTDLIQTFIDDVEDKIYDVFGRQDVLEDRMEEFNFWVYTKKGDRTGCGKPASSVSSDMPFRDADAVLHVEDFRDCSVGSRFSAEGGRTKAFLHESGHAVFGMADEYDGDTSYWEPANEPNIFKTQSNCTSEQSSEGRSTSACFKFTSKQNGWYKIHTSRTVMRWGATGDPWGTEGLEHLEWFFNNL
jgi:hypothetical protein